MTHKKLFKIASILSGIIIVLMIMFRNAQSEIFTVLSISLGGTIFYSVLFYLFQNERIRSGNSNTTIKYIFFGISIPLLVYGVEITRETDGFLKEMVRIILALEISYLVFFWVFQYRKNIQKLKSDKLEAELMLLKNQINPHFFFNTLNNLYSLIRKDADAAQDYVLKLSDLMRFTIYESGKEYVNLSDEVDYLMNFIELQTSRYHKEIDINFEKKIQNSNAKIAPLLFINLLENAFKHGVEKTTNEAFVHILLIENDQKITFTITNNFEIDEASKSKGIGLTNLKDRLNLIYPNTHQLSHTIKDGVFTATLEIYTK